MSFPAGATHAPVVGEDVARTVVTLLANPAPHIGKVYQLFGPELLSYRAIGELIGKVLGKGITYEQVSVQKMADAIGLGSFDHFKEHVRDTQVDDIFGIPNFNTAIEDITGLPPMSLGRFIEKNRGCLAGEVMPPFFWAGRFSKKFIYRKYSLRIPVIRPVFSPITFQGRSGACRTHHFQ